MLATFRAEGPMPAKLIGSTGQGLAEKPIKVCVWGGRTTPKLALLHPSQGQS